MGRPLFYESPPVGLPLNGALLLSLLLLLTLLHSAAVHLFLPAGHVSCPRRPQQPRLRLTMSASTYAYLTRCIPAISVLGVLFLLFVSLIVAPNTKQDGSRLGAAAATSQLVLAVYTLFIHIAPVLFPARLCWAIGDVMKRMKESVAVAEAYKKQTLEKGEAASSLKFVIIIPAYKESVETMEETLKVLGSHWQARSAYHVRSIFTPVSLILCAALTVTDLSCNGGQGGAFR